MPRKTTRKPHATYNPADDGTRAFPTTRKKVEITHLTRTQKEYSKQILSNDIVFGMGAAGTGKTYLAAQHAMQALSEGLVDRIIICRPAVEAGGEKMGFLPGGINEKMDPWVRPIFDVFQTHWSKKTVLDMLADGKIEISPLAYMRGRTFSNTFIIADEMQNATSEQLIMLLTRLGDGSKMVITGDPMQKDIKNSCFDTAKRRLGNVPSIAFIAFNEADVVRHPTVENILRAWDGKSQVDAANDDGESLGKLPRFISNDAA